VRRPPLLEIIASLHLDVRLAVENAVFVRAAAHYRQYGATPPRGVEHVGRVLVDEVVGQQDVDRRLVEAMAVAVRPSTVELAASHHCRRDAVTLQRAQEPPAQHVVVQLHSRRQTVFVLITLTLEGFLKD